MESLPCEPVNPTTLVPVAYNPTGQNTYLRGVSVVGAGSEGRGITAPNSLTGEKLGPNSGTTMVGNRVINNNNTKAPNNKGFEIAYGNGVVLGGVSNNVVERNLISGQMVGGVVVTDMPDKFKPEGNKVRKNVLKDNKYDLIYIPVNFPSTLFGNCFEDNEITSEFPDQLQEKAKCGGADTDFGDLSSILASVPPPPPDVDWKKVAAPPDQENMPNAKNAPIKDASDVPVKVDVASIKTPTA